MVYVKNLVLVNLIFLSNRFFFFCFLQGYVQTSIPDDVLVRSVLDQKVLFQHVWEKPARASTPRLVSWIAPTGSEIAINCDGSSLGSLQRSGFGGCLRDALGTWITGFVGYGGQATVLHMELFAIFHGLVIAWNRGFRKVVCYSDSLLVVTLV